MSTLLNHIPAGGRTLLPPEEARLAALVRLGDQEALALLVASHLRFVHKIARRYRYTGVPLEDLVAEGCVGIVQAARRFDPEYGVRFATYAVWWIRKAILASLGEKARLVRIPEGQVRRILQRLRSTPSPSRSRTVASVRQGSRCHIPPVPHEGLVWVREMSLSEAAAGTYSWTPLDWLEAADPSAEQELIRADRARKLRVALGRLTSQEQEVLSLRFGLDDRPVLTLRELGRRLGLSNERVRQIEIRARKRLAFLLKDDQRVRRAFSDAPARPARPDRGSGRSRRAVSAPGIS